MKKSKKALPKKAIAKKKPVAAKTKNTPAKQKPKADASQALRDLFVNELKDIYWAEKKLTTAIPKLIKKASAFELTDAMGGHLEETKEQVNRLEKVFASIGVKVAATKCDAMDGLIKEAERIIAESQEGPVRDAGIILAAQKVEHYEIATYGTLIAFAHLLDESEAVGLLKETLEEEKGANEKLTGVAESSINIKAAEKETARAEQEPAEADEE